MLRTSGLNYLTITSTSYNTNMLLFLHQYWPTYSIYINASGDLFLQDYFFYFWYFKSIFYDDTFVLRFLMQDWLVKEYFYIAVTSTKYLNISSSAAKHPRNKQV